MTRTILVLNTRPSDERCDEIAAYEAEGYKTFWWKISQDLPEEVNVSSADQLAACKKDAGPDAVYLTVWMIND